MEPLVKVHPISRGSASLAASVQAYQSMPVGHSETSVVRQIRKVAVIVATLGRPDIVSATVKYLLETQTLKPELLIISCAGREDAGDASSLRSVEVLTGPPGLPKQRNNALSSLPRDIELVVFFDDDFLAERGWLEAAARAFSAEPELVAFTGRLIADDIKGPGLSFETAVHLVESAVKPVRWSRIEPFSPYGCNMAFRGSAIGDLRFDERLVLYGWLEDRDFGGALAKRGGRLIKSADALGVHMGIKRGRLAGDRLGYSQVVNPVYMFRKKTMTAGQAAGQIFRNVASNLVLSIRPEPFVDRKGRLRGNLRGFSDVLLRGRLEPERAAMINPGPRR